jgi:hypothetical protein
MRWSIALHGMMLRPSIGGTPSPEPQAIFLRATDATAHPAGVYPGLGANLI